MMKKMRFKAVPTIVALLCALASTQASAKQNPAVSTERSLLGVPAQTSCTPPLTYCPVSTSCVDLSVSTANCGACGRSCTTWQSCSAGNCVQPPWLAQCSTPNVGIAYRLLAQPRATAAASSPVAVDKSMTGAEYLASTGYDPSAKLEPMPLPTLPAGARGGGGGAGGGNLTGVAVCSNNVALDAGPTNSPTSCFLRTCFSDYCASCSGTFVADPSGRGRLLFFTATHCVALNETSTMILSSSFVTCNRDAGVSEQGVGIFKPTAISMSRIPFDGIVSITDGALIEVNALSDTIVAYAQPVAVAAVTDAGLTLNVPNFQAGFPAITNRTEGCTEANIGDRNAIHYSRNNATRNVDNTYGIYIEGLSSCPGNSGGALMDEHACVAYGALSGSYIQCDSNSLNAIFFSRIVETTAEIGVPFLALASSLVAGQAVFVN